MASVTITIPNALITLYDARKVTADANATATNTPSRFPPTTQAVLERLVIEVMKWRIRGENYRIGDEAIINADEVTMKGI